MISIGRPDLPAPDATSTKYTRGMVAVVAGAMPGAAALASEAALRSGAGYVLLLSDEPVRTPHAVVQRGWSAKALEDARIGALLVGPGLGRGDAAREKLDAALASPHPLVIDGDALHLLDGRTFDHRAAPVVLTPHEGEFRAAFGDWSGDKGGAARAAAGRSGATIVFKGSDTVVAAPNGATVFAANGSPWLSTAGTGDVLAGAIAACVAIVEPFAAAQAGVWMHAEAARRLGGAFIADDLARELSVVRAAL